MTPEDLKRVDELIAKADACNKSADELDEYEDILPTRREGNSHALLAIAMMMRDQVLAADNPAPYCVSVPILPDYGSKP